MKSNVKPGMLARVVPRPGVPLRTPEIRDRIVFVERECLAGQQFKTTCGVTITQEVPYTELTWVVSSKTPLPMVMEPDMVVFQGYERPILDKCLRPIIDPSLDISDEEVRELYSPNSIPSDNKVLLKCTFDWDAYKKHLREK